MDAFKRYMFENTGPGGLKCPCCNSSRGKTKNSHVGKDNSLNKKARRKLKEDTNKEIKETT